MNDTDHPVPGAISTWTTSGDGIDALRRRTVPAPRPGPTEILVKITAVSLNYRDLLVINGVEGWRPTQPVTPVSDGVGRVVEVGDQVTRFRRGDRASGIFLPRWRSGPLTTEVYTSPIGGPVNRGVLADYVVFDEEEAVRIPAGLTDNEAASLPIAAVTAWHAVARRCRVVPGDRVLIHGTGGVSLFAQLFAQALGGSVMITSGSAEKLDRARALGAAQVANYRTTDVVRAVLDWTGAQGVDHVVETVGGANLNQSLRAVRLGGTIAFIGLLAGLAAPVNTYEFVTRNVTLQGIETGSREMFEELLSFVDEHRLRPPVGPEHAVGELQDALRQLERGAQFGKIVVRLRGTVARRHRPVRPRPEDNSVARVRRLTTRPSEGAPRP